MAVTLTGSDGLFVRLGKIEDLRAKIKTHQDLIDTEITDILDEYNVDRDMAQQILTGQEGFKAAAGQPLSTLRSDAQKTLIDMVHADTPLASKDIRSALLELIDQMENSSDDVNGSVVTAVATADAGNVGDGNLVVSATDAGGVTNQFLKPETMTVQITKDTQVTGTTGRDEVFAVSGTAPVGNDHPDWPDGSGIAASLRITSPDRNAQDSVGQTIIHNGSLNAFAVADTPDNWILNVGSPGTGINEEGTTTFRTAKSLMFLGDGAELTSMEQAFNTAGQSAAKVKPGTKYAISLRMQISAALAAGVLRISLKDGSDAIINDAAGVAISDSTTLSTLSISDFQVVTLVFTTAASLPSTVKIVVELTTAITSAENLFINDIVMAPMVQFGGPGGVYLIAHPGATDWVRDDKFTVAVANDYAGLFQTAFERWFNMSSMTRRNGLAMQLPLNLAAGESISDSLIS